MRFNPDRTPLLEAPPKSFGFLIFQVFLAARRAPEASTADYAECCWILSPAGYDLTWPNVLESSIRPRHLTAL